MNGLTAEAVKLLTGPARRLLESPGYVFSPSRIEELAKGYDGLADAVLRGDGRDSFVALIGRFESGAFLDDWAHLWGSLAGQEDPDDLAFYCLEIADALFEIAAGLDWQPKEDAEFAIGLRARQGSAVFTRLFAGTEPDCVSSANANIHYQ